MTLISSARALVSGSGLEARALRASVWSAAGFGLTQALRLAANLVLARLLFPEAFGLMALTSVVLQGLSMFSDVGLGPGIMRSPRGDDRAFLDTAWTIQIVRGAGLALVAWAVADPMAHFYDQPMLAELLPVAGVALLIEGFNPTRIAVAARHMIVGRVTMIDTLAQLAGAAVMITSAVAAPSVWALVHGAIAGALAKLALSHALLPGAGERLRWSADAARELVQFGRWIFLSTVCGFAMAQGDKAILGKYLTIEQLGVYNIGFFIASFPLMVGDRIMSLIMIPIYRDRPPSQSAENYKKVRRIRFFLTGVLIAGQGVFAFAGVFVISLLYDDRYAQAGAIATLVSCIQIIRLVGNTYDQAALAAGDSRGYFVLTALRAIVLTMALTIGAEWGGVGGALLGQGVAMVALHAGIVRLARAHGAWDPLHDGVYFALAAATIALALAINAEPLRDLAAAG